MKLVGKGSFTGSKEKKIAMITEILSDCAIVIMLVSLCIIGLGGSGAYSIAFSSGGENSPIYRGESSRAEVSLMFNVYQGNEYLESILDTLKAYGAHSTFFVGGCWADDNNALVQRIVDEGHEIANHGYFHKDAKDMSYQANKSEIVATNDLIKAITGKTPTLFAPPSGSYGKEVLNVCSDLGMKVIMWSRDTIDWRDKNTQTIYTRATDKVEAGELILAHPTYNTAEALPDILKYYKERGLTAVTVSQIISKTV